MLGYLSADGFVDLAFEADHFLPPCRLWHAWLMSATASTIYLTIIDMISSVLFQLFSSTIKLYIF